MKQDNETSRVVSTVPIAPGALASPVLGKRGPYETGAGQSPLLGAAESAAPLASAGETDAGRRAEGRGLPIPVTLGESAPLP